MNIEELSNVAMEIIAYAGSAKSYYLTALQKYKEYEEKEGKELIIKGDEAILIAHQSHAKLLAKEMQENNPQISLLLTHAEDQLMGAETIRILVEELKIIHLKTGG